MTSSLSSNPVIAEERPTETSTDLTVNSLSTEAPEKKVRKAYTITKSRESWTEGEHDKFLEALQLFDRDWKKIEDFVGSKTVIQIRSHAQKYFLKVEKNGTLAHVPPPRPKRKAAHPYPQKASKNAQMSLHVSMSFPTQINNVPGYTSWDDDTSALLNIAVSEVILPKDELTTLYVIESNGSTSEGSPSASCIASSSRTVSDSKTANQAPSMHGLPDFAEVYNFIGSVFDPDSKGRMKKLKEMDPINFETVLLLMRNLTVNLSNPDFEPALLAGVVRDLWSRTKQVIYLLGELLAHNNCLSAIKCCLRLLSEENITDQEGNMAVLVRTSSHQIGQSPARLGLTGPGSPSVQNLTPSRHGHPTSSSSSQSHHQQQQIQQPPPNLPPSSSVAAASSSSSAPVSSSALLSLLPPLPRAQALLQQMAVLSSKLFDVSPNRALWLSAFRGSLPSFLTSSHSLPPPPPLEIPNPSSTKEILSQFNSLQTQLFEAVTELQEILDLQDAKQKLAREIKSKDSSLLAFANKLKEAERVLDMLVDDYSDYRKPKRTKTEDEENDNESSTTVSSQLKLKDILAYAHKISYTTFAPPEFGAGQAPLRGALPPAPQDEQMRASQLYAFADLDIGLPKTVENIEKKVEALMEPPPPPPDLSAIQGLLPPNIAVPSGWKPGMPVELPKDWRLPAPPPGWKPGDPVVLPPELVPAPRAQEQQQVRPPQGLHRPPDVIHVREVQLDIMEDDSSEYSSEESSDDEE
ncbi:unnamed protein product [Brassica napus]|uniref:(rape) hypothetical protein n=1 Tax=Brassica napus TaxID=3708 RepID=A0A816J790_BRANA|nr:unnamed protein product [Brassica napus]